jgi:hypothetical protein
MNSCKNIGFLPPLGIDHLSYAATLYTRRQHPSRPLLVRVAAWRRHLPSRGDDTVFASRFSDVVDLMGRSNQVGQI